MSLESNIITGTPRMQTAEKHKQPFHMDGKKIVCNVCGEHFTNLVLFGNHTHGTDQKASIVPSDKSCPKSDHKTFNTMSEDEMIEAFHKMPELEGCWINNGRYICNMCGKSCPNPYILFSHKIIHPEDMTPMVKGKETDSQQTLGVATQTKIELGYGNRNRKLDNNIRIDSDDDDSGSGDAAADYDDNESGDAAAADDDDNVQKPMHLMGRPVKKLKEMNTGNSNAKSQKSLLYKNLISYDRGSTFLKSKSIAKEPGKKSKPATGGDRRTGLRLSSDSQDEVYDSTPITSDDDVDGDNSLNLLGRPNQHLDTTKYKKKETNLYQSLIAVKGWPFVKAKKPPFEYCGNMFGHNFLDKCKIFNGRYYCDECPRLYSSPYLLLNHKLYHAKCKCLTRRRHALKGTTHKREESHEDTTDEVEEAQVSTTDKEEEAQVSTTGKMEESHEDTTDEEEEAQVSRTDKMEETHEGTTDEEEEDSMCFECNLCQVKFDTTDGLADHIEAHAADTQAGASCTFSESALADVSKASTSACSTEMVDDTIVVKVKKEPVTDYVGDTLEPQLEPSGLDPSVRIKQEPEPSNLPQHSIEDRMRTGEVDVPFEDKQFLKRSMLSPVVQLKRIKIIHPEDMTPMVKGKETDSQQTLGVATQTKIELGCGNRNRKLDNNIRIDSDDDDSGSGEAAADYDDNESGDAAAADDDDNVQKPMHLMGRPVKKLKEMNTGNSNAKSQKSLLYKNLISYDRGSTFLKSKSIAKEPGKKSKPATGGDRRTGLRLSSDSQDEVYDSTPITSDDDVDGDNSLNLQGRPNQHLDTTKYKKKETNLYQSLIAVKGWPFVKAKKPPFEYCGNMFGHNVLDKCKIFNGRYYCDECPRLYSSPYLLLNHKLYHAKCKCLTQRRRALKGTTHKREESQEDTTDEVEEAQVSTTDEEEEAQVSTTGKMEESHEDTTDEEEESREDTDKEEEAQVSTTDKMEETHEGTTDEEEEDSMCFECNLCQVKFDTTDGLADHIEAHAADTQAGASCTLSESALADVSKASTSACSTEMVDDTIAVKVKMEPITSYAADRNTLEPQLEPSGLDPSVRIKQEPEPSNLPQHSIEDRMRTGEVDVPFEDKLFLKRSMLSPVVRLKRIKIEPNDVYIMK